MVHLIDKDALVAEIKRRIKSLHQVNSPREQAVLYECKDILSFLDSLEVKEVDLEVEVESLIKSSIWRFADKEDFLRVAKHFFELGLNASNPLTWKDIKEICVQSVLVEIDLGGLISDERHYTEVLKQFKAQKGE